jgi:hypothetical protein
LLSSVVSAKVGEQTERRKTAVIAAFGKDMFVLGKLVNWVKLIKRYVRPTAMLLVIPEALTNFVAPQKIFLSTG